MDKLPLDDPRWVPLKTVIDHLRVHRTGDVRWAILDLERDMARGKLRTMRRNSISGESKLVPASFWKTHVIDDTLPLSVAIYRRTAIDSTPQRWAMFAHQPTDRVDDLFYVWQPDFDALYFGGAKAESDAEPLLPIDRATAVLRELYQTKAEVPRRLNAITKAVNDECEKRGWQPVETDTVSRAAEHLGYRAKRKRRPPREHN